MSHNQFQVEEVTPQRSLLGEGPVWDGRNKAICWVDIVKGRIHQFFTGINSYRPIEVSDMVGAIALTDTGDFLAALKSGIAIVDRISGDIKLIHQPEAHLQGNRFNDGKCDPFGRFFIGSMAITEEPGLGSLYRMDADLTVSKILENVSVSNGLAWSSDHTKLYYIDSPTREVVCFNYNVRTGELNDRRTVIEIPIKEGFPDGMTIDTEDKLWIAHWDGWQVSRWDPETGKKLLTISIPVAKVTSCVFGGENLNDLYITTASMGLDEEQLAGQPLAGKLLVIKNCGYTGAKAHEFSLQNSGKYKK